MKNCVGLFGTCGTSTWRDPVMKTLHDNGVEFFNPVVPDWTPECAEIEADHLANDKVIFFVVTGETESFGSLAEIGFAFASCKETGRELVVVIQPFGDNPKSDANRTRKLVKAHAEKAGLTIFESIEEATEKVIEIMK